MCVCVIVSTCDEGWVSPEMSSVMSGGVGPEKPGGMQNTKKSERGAHGEEISSGLVMVGVGSR